MDTTTSNCWFRRAVTSLVFPLTMLASLFVMGIAISAGWSLAGVSLAISAAVLGLGFALEWWMPFAGTPKEEGERATDLGSMAIAVGLTEPALAALVPILVTLMSIELLPNNPSLFSSDVPLWMQFVVVSLLAELGRYWAHRLAHQSETLWSLHAMHHSPHRVNLLNNFRIHPLDQAFGHLLAIVPLVWLGAGPEVMMLYNVFYTVGIVFQHLDVDLDHGALNRWFSTNVVHRWHHSDKAPEGETNFGSVLIVWDRLFGTYYAPAGQTPSAFGHYDEQGYPVHNLGRQLLIPFCWKTRACCGLSCA